MRCTYYDHYSWYGYSETCYSNGYGSYGSCGCNQMIDDTNTRATYTYTPNSGDIRCNIEPTPAPTTLPPTTLEPTTTTTTYEPTTQSPTRQPVTTYSPTVGPSDQPSSAPSNSPTPSPSIENVDTGCIDGEECVVDCADYIASSFSCAGKEIDGTNYEYLTVNCDSSYECKDSTVYCPIKGCHIKCDANDACDGMSVVYDGDNEDNGRMQIDCYDYYSCHSMLITSPGISDFELNCNATVNDEQACYYLQLQATNGGRVIINSANKYGIRDSIINVTNAEYVSMTANGQYTFYSSTLYAASANSVLLKCISTAEEKSACSLSNYYLPVDSVITTDAASTTDARTTIECYAAGCYEMGNFYVSDSAETMSMSLNTCGQCEDQSDCMGSITYYCGNSYDSSNHWYGGSACSYDTTCGCQQSIDSMSVSNDPTDENCPSTGSGSAAGVSTGNTLSSGLIAGIIIAVIVGVCLICCLAWYCKKDYDRKQRLRENVNAVQQYPVHHNAAGYGSVSMNPNVGSGGASIQMNQMEASGQYTVPQNQNIGGVTAAVFSPAAEGGGGDINDPNEIGVAEIEPMKIPDLDDLDYIDDDLKDDELVQLASADNDDNDSPPAPPYNPDARDAFEKDEEIPPAYDAIINTSDIEPEESEEAHVD